MEFLRRLLLIHLQKSAFVMFGFPLTFAFSRTKDVAFWLSSSFFQSTPVRRYRPCLLDENCPLCLKRTPLHRLTLLSPFPTAWAAHVSAFVHVNRKCCTSWKTRNIERPFTFSLSSCDSHSSENFDKQSNLLPGLRG